MGELIVENRDAVAVVTLNRPERLNAITGPMLEAFSKAMLELDNDSNTRAIIITGAGRGFCAGLDLQDQMSGDGLGQGDGIGATSQRFNLRESPPVVLHNVDTPTICALNGGAAGYGMDMALGCDIRLASDRAKLAPAFTKRGVLPESGGTWLLPRIVGWSKAAEIMFTGRTLDAERCLELDLVSRVVPHDSLMDEALAMAGEIAANAPLAVQATKRMMRMGQNETFEANVHHVFLQLLPLFRTKDFVEGMTAFLEKRDPDFKGR